MTHRVRGWARACKCHETQYKEGKMKNTPCPMAGRRCREYAGRLTQFFQEIVELKRLFAASLELIQEVGTELAQDACFALGVLLGESKLRFAWVFQPPFTIWLCDDPEQAAKFIVIVRKQIRERDPNLNRVSAYFVIKGIDTLGDDFEAHSLGQGTSEILRTEMTVYQLLGRTEYICFVLLVHLLDLLYTFANSICLS